MSTLTNLSDAELDAVTGGTLVFVFAKISVKEAAIDQSAANLTLSFKSSVDQSVTQQAQISQ